MSDKETTGGTPESGEKSYTQAEVDALVESTRKDEGTKSWRHWQSVNDRANSTLKTERDAAIAELSKLRDEAVNKLPPEERTEEYLKEIRDGLRQRDPAPDNPPAQTGGGEDPAAQTRQQMSVILKEHGVDPAKIDWADDAEGEVALRRFVKSVVSQVVPPKGGEDEASREANRVDTSRPAGERTFNLKDSDPADLIRSGLSQPFKGG